MNGEPALFRKQVYALLIVVAAGAVAGRVFNAELVNEPSVPRAWPATRPAPMPTFSSNDRSRWATVRALVDGDPQLGQPPGTFAIGRRDRGVVTVSAVSPLAASNAFEAAVLATRAFQVRTKSDQGIIFEDGWQSVDKVLNPQTLEFISSKPPLLSVLMAGLYWILQRLTGWTLVTHPFAVVRTLLLLVNLVPLVIYLGLLGRLIDRFGRSDWGRFFAMACACFATFVTTFVVTFNNHSIATYCLVFSLYPSLRMLESSTVGGANPFSIVLAGFFASLTACCELPAAAFAVSLFVILLQRAPGRTLLFYLPAAAVPVAAFFVSNYLAVGQWPPVYSEFSNRQAQTDFAWYQYEGSHWRKAAPNEVKRGIDWAGSQESRPEYAFHVLFGHHGLFSLSPIWLLAIVGVFRFSFADIRFWVFRHEAAIQTRTAALISMLTLVLSVVVIGWYLVRTNNYGGWTSGLRWLIWLSPLWLLCLLPAADRLQSNRWGRGLCYILLAFSVLSVSYPAWNPWRHPWIYRLMEALGWPGY